MLAANFPNLFPVLVSFPYKKRHHIYFTSITNLTAVMPYCDLLVTSFVFQLATVAYCGTSGLQEKLTEDK